MTFETRTMKITATGDSKSFVYIDSIDLRTAADEPQWMHDGSRLHHLLVNTPWGPAVVLMPDTGLRGLSPEQIDQAVSDGTQFQRVSE